MFKGGDMPVLPPIFTRAPPEPRAIEQTGPTRPMSDAMADEQIHVSRRVLFDMCKGIAIDDIPPELRRILTGETSTVSNWKSLESLLATPRTTPQPLALDQTTAGVVPDQTPQSSQSEAGLMTRNDDLLGKGT